MTSLRDKIERLVQALIPSARSQPGRQPLHDSQIRNLMQALETTEEARYNCAETFALLDEYVELVNSTEDATALMPLVKHHLDACPECAEQINALLAILQSESASPLSA